MFKQPNRICLDDHHSMFISAFTTLLDNGALVDVTLAAEGRSIKAHKVVLSACSSYFKSLFIENPCKHPIVILKDVQYADLKLIVDFMYHGEIEVPEEQATQFSGMVNMLGIKILVSAPLYESRNQSSGRAVSLTPNIPLPVECFRESTVPTSEEQNSNKWSSDKTTARKSTSKTLPPQHNQVNPKMLGRSQKTPVVFPYPYPPIDVRPTVICQQPIQPQPIQPSSSRQSNLGGMSSGGNQKDRSQSHSRRRRMENTVQQPVYREGSTPNNQQQQQQQHKQQMINQTSASEAHSTQRKRKLSFCETDLRLALYKMRQGENSLIRVAQMYNWNEEILRSSCKQQSDPKQIPNSRLDNLLISQQNLTASATATTTDINNTSKESSERLSQSSANITVPPDDNGVFDANKNC